jgi:hypothetical protein
MATIGCKKCQIYFPINLGARLDFFVSPPDLHGVSHITRRIHVSTHARSEDMRAW